MNLSIAPEVAKALAANKPVVALESTVIAHGLPRPRNLSTARALEAEIRAFGVVPATIALHDGVAVVGAGDVLLERLANEAAVAKVSIRDIAPVLAARTLGGTTVAATVTSGVRGGRRRQMTRDPRRRLSPVRMAAMPSLTEWGHAG